MRNLHPGRFRPLLKPLGQNWFPATWRSSARPRWPLGPPRQPQHGVRAEQVGRVQVHLGTRLSRTARPWSQSGRRSGILQWDRPVPTRPTTPAMAASRRVTCLVAALHGNHTCAELGSRVAAGSEPDWPHGEHLPRCMNSKPRDTAEEIDPGGLRRLRDQHDVVAQVAQALDQLGRGALACDLVEIALPQVPECLARA